MADYHWPPAEKRSLIGKRISRIDGPWKASGRAKYSFDVNRPGMLYGKMALSPHPHAKIEAINTSVAEKMPGVRGVQLILEPGNEVMWVGQEILAIAADTEEQARDAVRAVKVTYTPLPFFAQEVEPSKAGQFTKVTGEVKAGDPDAAFKEADVVHEGVYGIPVIAHCCLESHGLAAEWSGDNLRVWASTQGVSTIAGDLSTALGHNGINVSASKIEVITPVMGGGFGSKFQSDTWGLACAQLSKKTGKAVKMLLERDHELMVAGARPSMHAKIRVGAKKDGTLTVWDSETWGNNGTVAASPPQLPYVIIPPNRRTAYTAVLINMGPTRAWRAPNHPQLCALTLCALDDLADKLDMDPVEFLKKNLNLTNGRAQDYAAELDKAAELMDWKSKWHPRGDKTPGHIKRGVGVSLHTWGGGGGPSNCQCVIQPDGSVTVSLGTQDLGVGTRTVVTMVAAETMGLPLEGVTANIGDSKYPASGPSGGSTTVGGVSSSTRRAATNALNELLAKVAPSLNATADQLEAVGGRIQVIGDPSRSIDWKAACAKLAGTPITAMGQKQNPRDDLLSSGVGGVQMAEVSVDIETGIVKVEKMVAVQDVGLVMNLKLAESQVYGAMIMGVTYALYEEKLMDSQTGQCLNPNMEFYKLAGINDVGELVVHMMTGPGYDERGPIGIGEPPVISPGAVLSNAVANAIGTRVPELPLTPANVLAALSKV
ncbi:MAG TPA: xanthine dehydrogenase family protein molybdopterin-binding subunit [Methylomirabilota bacterium]|nr:xanthine dehydrogenase family protein molybdopterin-binding subunit [Methylomirabilota bacterium]